MKYSTRHAGGSFHFSWGQFLENCAQLLHLAPKFLTAFFWCSCWVPKNVCGSQLLHKKAVKKLGARHNRLAQFLRNWPPTHLLHLCLPLSDLKMERLISWDKLINLICLLKTLSQSPRCCNIQTSLFYLFFKGWHPLWGSILTLLISKFTYFHIYVMR